MLYRKGRRGCEEDEVTGTDLLSSLSDIDGDLTEIFLEQTRRILVVGEIDEFVSLHVNSQLQRFSTSNKPVYMYISSPGGHLIDGYAIIDQMQLSPFPIYTIVRGQAHSMAAIIAAYGTRKCRFITPRSSVMLHSILFDLSMNSIEQQQKAFQYVRNDYETLIIDLANRIHLTPKKLTALMKETHWMDAREAIKVGIVDGIWTPKMEHTVNLSAIEEEARKDA